MPFCLLKRYNFCENKSTPNCTHKKIYGAVTRPNNESISEGIYFLRDNTCYKDIIFMSKLTPAVIKVQNCR